MGGLVARLVAFIGVGLVATACGPSAELPPKASAGAAPVVKDGPLVAFLGDSLTAGWNLSEEQAFPALIEQRLREQGRPVRVLNAGVSGDTTAGGLARLDWILRQKPAVVVVALGANDGLRGLDLGQMQANLRQILDRVAAGGAKPLLVGMKIPPSLGPEYARDFEETYTKLARTTGVPFVPFLLDGVAGRADLTFPDGLHPTAEGHVRMTATVLPYVVDVLSAVGAARS